MNFFSLFRKTPRSSVVEAPAPSERSCNRCKNSFPLSSFSPSQQHRRTAWCRDCFRAYAREKATRKVRSKVEIRVPSARACPRCNVTQPDEMFVYSGKTRSYTKSICHACSIAIPREKNGRIRKLGNASVVQAVPVVLETTKQAIRINGKAATIDVPIGSRYCSRCEVIKQVSSFSRNRSKASGFNHECTSCRNVDRQKWRARQKSAPELQTSVVQVTTLAKAVRSPFAPAVSPVPVILDLDDTITIPSRVRPSTDKLISLLTNALAEAVAYSGSPKARKRKVSSWQGLIEVARDVQREVAVR